MDRDKSTLSFSDDEYEMRLLLEKPHFKRGVQKIRKKWNIPANGFADNKAINKWRDETESSLEDYQHDVWLLLSELNLSKRWQQGVSYFIQNNLPGMLRVQSPNPLIVSYEGGSPGRNNIRAVSIEVDSITTEREVKERLKEAKELLGAVSAKKQPLKNLDRNLEILRMNEDGMKASQIAKRLNDTSGSVFNEDDIKLILKRMRRRLE